MGSGRRCRHRPSALPSCHRLRKEFSVSTGTTTLGKVDTTRRAARFVLLAALVAGSLMLLRPATASADALVWTQAPCVAYANGGTNVYSGSGTSVTTPNGGAVLTCHLTLVSGTPVERPTSTTNGNTELLQLPSGRAVLTAHYQL